MIHRKIGIVYEKYEETRSAAYFVGELAYTESMKELARGSFIQSGGTFTEDITPAYIENEIDVIRDHFESSKSIALSDVKSPGEFYGFHYGDTTAVFIKSEKGIVGCGWKSGTDLRSKASFMCAFILYAVSLNSEDGVFKESAEKHVIYQYGTETLKEFEHIILNNSSQQEEKVDFKLVRNRILKGGD